MYQTFLTAWISGNGDDPIEEKRQEKEGRAHSWGAAPARSTAASAVPARFPVSANGGTVIIEDEAAEPHIPARTPHAPQASGLRRISTLLDRESVAWATLVITLILTVALWRFSDLEFARRADEAFQLDVDKLTRLLGNGVQDYEQVLRGGAALFEASGRASREEWRRYVRTLALEQSFPGIQDAGYAPMNPRGGAFRSGDVFDAAIHPVGDRIPYGSVLYTGPFDALNLPASGQDLHANPVLREAMDRARDTGQPAVSGKAMLAPTAGAQGKAAFLMFVPVYRDGSPGDAPVARREALTGFVYGPFRAADLLSPRFVDPARSLEIEVFDGEPAPANLLFSSSGYVHGTHRVTERTLEVGGRAWTARVKSTPRFEAGTRSSQPEIILFGGLTLDLLLFSMLYMNARHRRAMRAVAKKLEQSLDSFRTLVENVPGAVFRSEVGSPRPVLQLSHGVHALTGEPPERFLSGALSYADLIHPDDRAMVSTAVAEAIARRGLYNIEYRIRTADGFTRWVSERGRVSADHAGRTRWLDGLIFDVTERKAAEIMIRDLAFNDPLTGLPNRRLFLDRLEHQLAASSRTGQHGALLFIDMDEFKSINDTFGHEAGDEVLNEVARRLVASVRESDTVARLGGDEFVVILDNLGDTAHAACAEAGELGYKILVRLAQPYRVGERLLNSTPSIGIMPFCGHAFSPDELLRRADQAMYKAKSAGRNQLQFYEAHSPAAALAG